MNPFLLLYQTLESTAPADFYKLESDFFPAFYSHIPENQRPDCVVAFLTISTWMGTSLRSGVWTYYEGANPAEIETTRRFLKEHGSPELEAMFAYGIHDYQNPVYRETFDYPEEWIAQSDTIDQWITEKETTIQEWLRAVLLKNKEMICAL